MAGSLTDIQVNFLKQSLALFFDIDESFVDISAVRSDEEDENIYKCELKIETSLNSLRKFHLSVYTFYIHSEDEDGFIYEDQYYKFDDIHPFLEKLSLQIREPGGN